MATKKPKTTPSPAPEAEEEVTTIVPEAGSADASDEESLTNEQQAAASVTDADVQAEAVKRVPSSHKVAKAKEIAAIKDTSDPTVAEPSSYHGMPLTAEEAAATRPEKYILAEQMSREETESEAEEEEPVRKGHITTDEERLALTLKPSATAAQKAKVGGQAPLQFANAKAENASERSDRVAQSVADSVRTAVKGKV